MADGSDSTVKGRKSRKVEDPGSRHPCPRLVLLKGIASLTGVKSTFPTALPGFAIDKYFVVVLLLLPLPAPLLSFPFLPSSFAPFFRYPFSTHPGIMLEVRCNLLPPPGPAEGLLASFQESVLLRQPRMPEERNRRNR